MINIIVNSTSNKRTLRWADVAIPFSEGMKLPSICKYVDEQDDIPKVAIKGRNVGTETTLFHIYSLWDRENKGHLAELDDSDEDKAISQYSFRFSDWVSSDPLSLIPKPILEIEGEEYSPEIDDKSRLISINQAVAVFYVKFKPVLGFNTECFIKVYSEQDGVEFSWNCYYSNPNSPTYNAPMLNELRVSSKVPFVIHWAQDKLIGCPSNPMDGSYTYTQIPMNEYNIGYIPDFDVFEYSLLKGVSFREGQGCEITGYLLGLPQGFINAIQNNPLDSVRIENLMTFQHGDPMFGGVGEVRGVAQNMNPNNEWSVFGRVPEVVPNARYTFPNPFYTKGMFGMRKIGMTPTPGQTGGQEDFGSEKGIAAVTLGIPKWITYYRAALTDMYRYFHIDDFDGNMVRSLLHPKWTTWNMETHDQTTQDTLGKTKYAPRPNGNGWRGYDNEHRSQNGVLAWFALTGDYMIEKMIHRCIENEGAQVPNRAGAEREVGRLLLTYSKMFKLTEGYYRTRILAAMKQKIGTVVSQWRGRFFQNDPARTVRVLQVIKDPRSNVYDAQGNLDFAWAPYQTALMVVGMYAAARTLKAINPDDPVAAETHNICKQLAETVTKHGIFKKADGNWIIATFAAYRTATPQISGWIPPSSPTADEGLPLDDAEYLNPKRVTVGNGFIDWTGPAIAIARVISEDQTIKDRATDFINYFYPNGFQLWDSAEWWACAPLKQV